MDLSFNSKIIVFKMKIIKKIYNYLDKKKFLLK